MKIYITPLIIFVLSLMVILGCLFIAISRVDSPGYWLKAVYVAVCAIGIVFLSLAFIQRIKEIKENKNDLGEY
ncbi:MAG: hypothetical protein OEY59_03265 [Deltaproteobacteria bacterium]|nr:hypothetical protein [Deltaproteobacteria bacterium]